MKQRTVSGWLSAYSGKLRQRHHAGGFVRDAVQRQKQVLQTRRRVAQAAAK